MKPFISCPRRLSTMKPWKKSLLSIVLLLGISFFITFLALYIEPNSMGKMVKLFVKCPLLIPLNYTPILLIMVFFSALTKNVFYGGALTNVVVGGFSLASRMKCTMRQEPLYPRDLQLIRELGQIIGEYNIDMPVKVIAVLVLLTVFLIAAGVLFRRWDLLPKPKSLIRWGSVLGSVAVVVVLIFTVYANHALYTCFPDVHYFNVLGAYNDLGFPYSFCYSLTNNSIDKPEGYDPEAAALWDSQDTNTQEALPVNVIYIMSESFTDIADGPSFHYTPETDPTPFYHQLIGREDVISGHLVVSDMGGGTANTEFDVMTGIRSDTLSPTTAVAFRTLGGNLDSIFREYRSAGYTTSYIHPGNEWFYNRNHILPWFGAESTTFREDIKNAEWLGGFISDNYTAGLTISQFEKDTADGSLVFNYTTTIQNHMSYTETKYEYALPELPCSKDLDDDVVTQLSVYIEGLRYADAALEKVVDYFESCGKPVMLVFFGDHYPFMGDERSGTGYVQLGLTDGVDDEPYAIYNPPYLIWANQEAQTILDWETRIEELAFPEYMSACYLGAGVLELTGLGDNSSWFSYLNELRRELPVAETGKYMDNQGNVTDTLTPEAWELVQKWQQWSYYRLITKTVSD